MAFADVDAVAEALRRRGGRLTAPRRRVIEALFAAEGPIAAERIAQGRALELTSVYRTLESLEQMGVVAHVHLGHGPGLYGLTGGTEREYLVCERCNAVKSVPATQLDAVRAQIAVAFGYRARFGHFPIVGLCPACAAGDPHGHPGLHTHEHSHGDFVHAHPHAGHDHAH